jgi:4-diphosphocytidyl-2-C-methyl-D-erythritol kinase
VRLHRLDVDDATLAGLALAVGSDVPYFLEGGRRRGTGRGELLETLPDAPPRAVLLVRPRLALSTAAVFAEHARLQACRSTASLTSRKTGNSFSEEAWNGDDLEVRNDLLDAATSLAPVLRSLLQAARAGFPEGQAGLTGSGPTSFVLLPPDGAGILDRARRCLPGDVDLVLTRTVGAAEFAASRLEPLPG